MHKQKKGIRLVASLTLLSSLVTLISSLGNQRAYAYSNVTFTDVSRTAGYGPGVYWVADNGWVSGYADIPSQSYFPCSSVGVGSPCFLPNNSASRGQISKMIVNAKGSEGVTPINPPSPTFSDVPYGSTFYQYIETMNYYGWASGYSDNPTANSFPCRNAGVGSPCFLPNNTTTRGQFSKMVVNAMNQVRNRVNPPSPTFSDVPYGSTFYTFVETSWAHFLILDNGGPYPTTNFRVGDPIARGDVANALFSVTSLELTFGHNSLYAGSNNWDGPNTSCASSMNSGSATFLPGNLGGYSSDYGGFGKYRATGREIQFDTDARNYLTCNTSNRVAIVFHAKDNFGSNTGCQDGSYSNWYTTLPSPTGLDVKGACVQWWGSDNSEARIYTSNVSALQANSAQYMASIDWSPNDFGAVNDGQINIDNYQLDSGGNKLYNDNMQKFCYSKGSAATNQPGNRYAVFPCP